MSLLRNAEFAGLLSDEPESRVQSLQSASGLGVAATYNPLVSPNSPAMVDSLCTRDLSKTRAADQEAAKLVKLRVLLIARKGCSRFNKTST